MSHTLSTKNYNKTSTTITKGEPDYIVTSSDAFPTPPTAAGDQAVEMTLMVSDTGAEFKWTGEYWVKSGITGAAMVAIQPDTNEVVGSQFYSLVATTTLSVAAASQDRIITLTDATGFVVGLKVAIGGTENTLRVPTTIISVTGSDIELSIPLDLAYTVGTSVIALDADMNVAGNSTTPTVFSVAPPPGEFWHISKIAIGMTHDAAGDMGLFGDIAALTYGVVIRLLKNGVYFSYTAWRTNSDISLDTSSIRFDMRSGGQGSYSTIASLLMSDLGTTFTLDGDTDDELQLLIQDDLSSLVTFQARASGYKYHNALIAGE